VVYEKIADYGGARMTEVSPDQLKQTVESQHGGTATFVQSVPLREMRGEQLVWEGTVHVFDLHGQPDGHFRAYLRRFLELQHGLRKSWTLTHTD
jgi:hypothetical protein